MRFQAILFRLCLFALPCLSARHNPLIPGFNPDPAPILVDGWYYLATSSFEYYPAVPVYRSQDLSNWELFSHALTKPSQLQLFGTPTGADYDFEIIWQPTFGWRLLRKGVWAPTMSYQDGTFYLASMTRWTYDPVAKVWPRIFWSSSRDLVEWSDPVWSEPWGIDPELYHDTQSGKSYLNVMAPNNNKERLWGISQCEVDLETGQCIGAYRSLWNGTLPHNATARPEGPKMLFRDGYYYLLIAEGGTDLLHRASIARSRSPEGPFIPGPNNPILYNGDQAYGNLTVQSTGHGTIIETPDNRTYIIYLARRNVNGSSPLGRETFISSVEWKDGWPIVNGGKPVLLSDAITGLPDKKPSPERRTDSFNRKKLNNDWYTLRSPYTQVYSLEHRGKGQCSHRGGVSLFPNVFDLSDRDVPAAILRKQTSLNMTFSATTFPLPKLSPGQAVGVSAYLSELAHHDVAYGLCRNATGYCIYTSLIRNGTETYDEVTLEDSEGSIIEFHIRAEPLTYTIGFTNLQNASEVKWLASFPSSWMAFAPPNWFVFEGAMFALFATGKGQPWTSAGPTVGFCSTTELFYSENVPDYDTLA